jgi:alpha/beta superfamily hydrolase
VVQTLARAHVQAGWTSWRFNFRGVGRSSGQWDEGRGEIDDALAVAQAAQASSMASSGTPGCTVAVAGFSFGAFVASQLARRLATAGQPARVVSLIAPAVVNFDVALPLPTPLVVHGSADDVVPLSGVLSWAEEQRGLEGRTLPITVLPGVGHFFHGELGLLKQIVMSHLNLNELSSL